MACHKKYLVPGRASSRLAKPPPTPGRSTALRYKLSLLADHNKDMPSSLTGSVQHRPRAHKVACAAPSPAVRWTLAMQALTAADKIGWSPDAAQMNFES
jgi:hypothetical protein